MSSAFHMFAMRHSLADDDLDLLNSLIERDAILERGMSLALVDLRGNLTSVVLEGYLARLKTAASGKEQFVGLYQPGDLPDLCGLARSKSDTELVSIGRSRLALIRRSRLTKTALNRKSIAVALWRELSLQQSISNEWLLSLGQRTAEQRVAHFFLERLNRQSDNPLNSIELPLRQRHLAALVGVSEVHINRIMKDLRTKGYMRYTRGVLKVENRDALIALSGFSETYITDPLAHV